jgi:hypothetical protein
MGRSADRRANLGSSCRRLTEFGQRDLVVESIDDLDEVFSQSVGGGYSLGQHVSVWGERTGAD